MTISDNVVDHIRMRAYWACIRSEKLLSKATWSPPRIINLRRKQRRQKLQTAHRFGIAWAISAMSMKREDSGSAEEKRTASKQYREHCCARSCVKRFLTHMRVSDDRPWSESEKKAGSRPRLSLKEIRRAGSLTGNNGQNNCWVWAERIL